MQNKKSQITLFIILIIVLGIIALFFLPKSPFRLNILDDETRLKQEYVTYWANDKDSVVDKFILGDNIQVGIEVISIGYINGQGARLTSKHNFFGQEVVILFSTQSGVLNNVQPPAQGEHLLILKPHTFEPNKVDWIFNGRLYLTTTVSNPFFLQFYAEPSGGGKGDVASGMTVFFIGYKAEFACNLASDEVWVQESFANRLDIEDLSFPAVKFCDAERPFTLRNIAEGEKKIRFEEGILPLNKGETIPPRELIAGEIITINYATPNVIGVTNKCGIGEANVKLAGVWVCQNVIQKTILIREVPIREIIPITSVNSWQFVSDRSFINIGSKQFAVSESYNCAITEGETIRAPSPEKSCWKTKISYDGKGIELIDSQTADIEQNIKVQFFAEGQSNDLAGRYLFALDGDAVSIDAKGGDIIKHNEPSFIAVDLQNNMPLGKVIVKVTQRAERINFNLPEQELNFVVVDGQNKISIPINTENLGVNSVTIQGFYIIESNAVVLLPSEKLKVNVDITEGQSIVKFVEKEEIKQKNIFQQIIDSIIAFFRNLFS